MGNIKDKPRYFFDHDSKQWLEIVPHPDGADCFHRGVVQMGNLCALFKHSACIWHCKTRKATFKEIPIVQH